MGFLDRFRRTSGTAARHRPSSKTQSELEAFLRTRTGVEGYVEPPTAVYAMTLCLVAGDGEHLRRPVKHAQQAHQLCKTHGVPVYDARIVGYPRRMREHGAGRGPGQVSLDDLPPLDTTDGEPDRG